MQFRGCSVNSGTPRAAQVFSINDGCAAGPIPLQLGKVYNVRVLATSAEVGVERALLQFRFGFAQAELPPEFSICRKLEVPFYRPGFEAVESQGPYVRPPRLGVQPSNVVEGERPPGRAKKLPRPPQRLQELPGPLKARVAPATRHDRAIPEELASAISHTGSAEEQQPAGDP